MKHHRRFLRRNLAPLLLAFSSAGCIPDCEGRGSTSQAPPQSSLSYPTPQMRLWATVAAQPNTPVASGFTPVTFFLNAALPAGLTFDAQTGTIAGTPTAPQIQTLYNVGALSNQNFNHFAHVQIEVFDAIAPSALSYTPSATTVQAGEPLTPLVPTVSGVVEQFSIAPALPPGLVLDPSTGRISGAASSGVGLVQYTVTAANPIGSTQATVAIEVVPGLATRGFLVPSAFDATLDVFDERGTTIAPIDSLPMVVQPRAVAASSDGRWVYAVGDDQHLYRSARDPLSGRLVSRVDLGAVGAVRRLRVSADRRYLVAAGNNFVRRWDLAPDGNLCCAVEAPGPSEPSVLEFSGGALVLVGASAPGELRAYDLEPNLALRGAPLNLGPTTVVAALDNFEPGASFFAATSVYSESTSSFSGSLRTLTISTPAQVAGGAAALVQTQAINVGQQLTDVRYRAPDELLVVDRSAARLQHWRLNSQGAIVAGSSSTFAVGQAPSQVQLGLRLDDLWLLDEDRAELIQVGIGAGQPPLMTVRARVRTRAQPLSILPLRGVASFVSTQQVFVASAGDSTLLALRAGATSIASLEPAAQGPVATGATPRDVAAHPRLPVVYTANWGAATIGVYSLQESDMSSSLLEDEALSPGARPLALALTPGGRHLHAIDENGRVVTFTVSDSNGELDAVSGQTLPTSLVDARLRADRLGRFLFVVQPNAARVTTLTINLPTGFTLTSSFETSLPRPVDLWTSPDGRFAYVLDGQLARVVVFAIDAVSGVLVPTGSEQDFSGGPTQLLARNPAELGDSLGLIDLLVHQPLGGQSSSVQRNPLTGALATAAPNVYEAPVGSARIARLGRDVSDYSLHIVESGPNAQLVSGVNTGAFPAPWSTVDSVPLGAGPRALATRTVRD